MSNLVVNTNTEDLTVDILGMHLTVDEAESFANILLTAVKRIRLDSKGKQ